MPTNFISKITTLDDPIVEAIRFRLNGPSSARESAKFMRAFMEGKLGPDMPKPPTKYSSPGSTPAVLIYDQKQPLSGLAALGHEAAERLLKFGEKDWEEMSEGDVLVIHARERSEDDGFGGFATTGGATDLGRLRHAMYHAAVKKGLAAVPDPKSPLGPMLKAVWVYNFPLFTRRDKDSQDPGQGGAAGFSSTHHPFTAPLLAEDLELLRAGDPLRAKADHYDLVINGVEVGGGSRRIHVAEVQEFVLREVLRMGDAGVAQFAHLLEALRAGCPPHAGFALGFDRLLTVLWDVPSVRDVMAFPKNNKGEDPLVSSPSKTTPEQQKMYHLFRTETE